MSGRPFYPRYQSDALTGYANLTLELRGAYTTLLDMLYDSDWDEGLVDNERQLAGNMNISIRKYRLIRDELLQMPKKLIRLTDGRLTNPRYMKERQKALDLSRKRATAGSEGGKKTQAQREFDGFSTPENVAKTSRKRRENATSHEDNFDETAEKANDLNGGTQASASDLLESASRARASPYSRDHIDNGSIEPSSTALDPVDLAEHFSRIAGIRHLEPARIIQNVKYVREWVDLGVDVADVETTILTQRDRSGSPIHSLRYFDAAVRRIHAQKEHPADGNRPHQTIEDIRDPILRDYLLRRGEVET